MSLENKGHSQVLRITIATGDGSDRVVVSPSARPDILLGSTEGVRDLARVQYRRIGHCIYCGASCGLSREHIIPYGLGGIAVLPDASCGRCSRVTGKFEAEVLRGSMRPVRVVRALASRKKHAGAPLDAEVTVRRCGQTEKIRLPLADYPVVLPFPTFPPPRFLQGRSGTGVDFGGLVTVSFGKSPAALAQELGAEEIVFQPPTDRPTSFARMLAKIAYGMAVAQEAHLLLDGPSTVLPAILGEKDDIGDWVGTLTGPIRKYPGLLHRIGVGPDLDRGLLLAEVQLFADSETPTYGVVLGRLKP